MANRQKDPNAVALGRKGGLKGGKARWRGVGKRERSRVTREAAGARWLLLPPTPDGPERPAEAPTGPPRMVSWFSGIGGIDLAAEREGFQVVALCERDPDARKVLQKRFPGVPIHDDVRTFDASTVPGPIDILVGGFPCQDISRAGKRKGLAGERSGLFWEIVRYAKEVRPGWGLFENVENLLSSPKDHPGLDFWRVLRGLRECWPAVGWRVLDSRDFGVAQHRERVIIACAPSAESVEETLSFVAEPASDPRRLPITRRPTRWPRAGLSFTDADGHGVLLDMSDQSKPFSAKFYVAVYGLAPVRPILLSHDYGGVVTHGETRTLTAQGARDYTVWIPPKEEALLRVRIILPWVGDAILAVPLRAIPCAECEREAFLLDSAPADYSVSPVAARGILRRHDKAGNPPLPEPLRRALEERASEDGHGGKTQAET